MTVIRLILFAAMFFAASVFANQIFFSPNPAEEEKIKRASIIMFLLFAIALGIAIIIGQYW